MSAPLQRDPVARLRKTIALLLSGTLGATPFPSEPSRSPIILGLHWGAGYAVFFCALPWVVFRRVDELFWLSVWGSCYFACAATLAASTSSAIFKVIEGDILPALSEQAAIAIDKDVVRRFDRRKISVISSFVAIAAAALSAGVLHYDLKSSSMFAIGWLCCGYFILYITAARTTYIARFYGTFAAHLKLDPDRIYFYDPAHSLQVTRIAWVGQRVLWFWFAIVCLVATLVPLFSRNLPYFVGVVTPIASFFSVVFGTVIFLNSESDIRFAVKKSSQATLKATESEIAELFSARNSLHTLKWERLKILIALHDKLVATGTFRSALLSGLSLLVPLIGPAVTAIWTLLRPHLVQNLSHPK